MGKFIDVFRGDPKLAAPDFKFASRFALPGLWQEYVTAHFAEFVQGTNLHHWDCGAPIAKCEKRFLIGAATYSDIDMRLLDVLDSWLEKHKTLDVRIDVFDIGVCGQIKDLDNFSPLSKTFS